MRTSEQILLLIFEKVTAYLNQGRSSQGSQLSHLIEAIENDKVSSDFTQSPWLLMDLPVFLPRKSGLWTYFMPRVLRLLLGLMLVRKPIPVHSLKAISIKPVWSFSHHLAFKYQTPAQDHSQTHEKMDSFDKASRLLESSYDFSELTLEVDEKDREKLTNLVLLDAKGGVGASSP